MKKQNSLSPKRLLLLALLALILVGLVYAVGFLVCDEFAYMNRRDGTKAEIRTLLDKVQPPKAQSVYYEVIDQGCNKKTIGYSASNSYCELTGYKYFKDEGDLGSNMKSLDSVLTQSGFSKYTSYADKDNRVLNGVEGGIIEYGTGVNSSIAIESYFPGNSIVSPELTALINSKKINSSGSKSPIFGVRRTEMYWLCSNTHVLNIPCPTSSTRV